MDIEMLFVIGYGLAWLAVTLVALPLMAFLFFENKDYIGMTALLLTWALLIGVAIRVKGI